MSNQYYIQDARDYVGNDVLWWAEEEKGYTTDLNKALIVDDNWVKSHQRSTDIPWPKDYIDRMSRPAVDYQYLDKSYAGLKEKPVIDQLRDVLGPAIKAAQSRVGTNVRMKDDESLIEAGKLLGVTP